ncbi:MAG: AmmeMemoRadiSam system protein B [Nannocystaceae bacterium]
MPAKLRKLERHELLRDDEHLIVLRDPLGISDPVALPKAAGDVLDLLDGTRTAAQIRQSLLMRGKLDVPTCEITELIAGLQGEGMLDDDAFRDRFATILQRFLAAPVLRPRHAGIVYPADPDALKQLLGDVFGNPSFDHFKQPPVLGVVCPHQPPTVVGSTLRQTLDHLPRARDIDVVVLLATDHAPGLLPYVTTDKQLASPLGCGPVSPLCEALERDVPWIRREEIRFRQALSVELQVVLLHSIYGADTPPILPILCGQTALDEAHADEVDSFLAAMERLLCGSRVLFWTAAELSHVGPDYGSTVDPNQHLASIEQRDQEILEALSRGRPQQLLRRCSDGDPQFGQPSGGAALTTLARLVPVGTRGEKCSYKLMSPPDIAGVVGVAGLKLRAQASAPN